MGLSPEVSRKYQKLQEILAEMGSVLIGFSGGVDSSLLLKVALEVPGVEAAAATARSATYPESEVARACELAAQMGARHFLTETHELENDAFAENPPDRCYLCKAELFGVLKQMAAQHGYRFVADGANADDLDDFRPGRRAAVELGVRSPLQEAGFSKADIRELARHLGLPNWDKPSLACLSSRFPYGQRITPDRLRQVAEAEQVLRSYGVRQCRVRHHDPLARIEVAEDDLPLVLQHRVEIARALRELGFTYITLDLQGYRTGSMNDVLPVAARERALSPLVPRAK